MNFKQLVRQNYQFLLERLDASHELFGGLQRNGAIQHKIASIKEQQTPGDKISALLSALLDVPAELQASTMDDVIEALRSSGQGHLANTFRSRVSDKVPMSDAHYRQLQKKMAETCKYADPENGLLDQLFSAEVISCSEVERIRCSTGRNEMTRKLIETLMKKSDDAFETLINALNEVGQTHITYILTGKGNARPLSQKLRDKLMMNRVKLITSIYFNGLVSVLMSKRVFTEYDQQHVESRQTANEKIERALDLIARKSQSAFCKFIVALSETHHEHVVVEMIGVEIAAKVELIIDSNAAAFDRANLETELREMMQDAIENDETMVKGLANALDGSETSLTGVEEGSVIVKFRCKNVEALRELYRSETLDKLFTETFGCSLAHRGLMSIRLHIASQQFEHCAEKFTAQKLMTPEHRETLLSSEKFLVQRMVVSDDLLNKLPLCRERRRAIETAPTRDDQVKTLLDIVSRQPDSAFTQLLDALTATQQEQSALILSAPLLREEEDTLPRQPEAAWKMADYSMRHLISKFNPIDLDDETITAMCNLQTSIHSMRQICSTTAQRTTRDDNWTEQEQIDSCQYRQSEVAANGKITAKQPMPTPYSTATSLKENQLITIENRKLELHT